ncbi:MAG: hypothetical protein K1X67_22510 [Fimbriimonadaceae bacterium]|nr:hypothetical protein [Fimbriimonadaceae bacterium]
MQRIQFCLILALLVALVGCGKKEEGGETTATTPPAKTSTTTEPEASTTSSIDESKVVGEWKMASEQGNTTVDSDISIKDDGTFVNSGTITGVTDGEDAKVTVTASYTMEGKWKLENGSISTTPDSVEATVEDVQIEAKDPANQAALEAGKEELKTKAAAQMKDSMNKPSTSKVESATDEKLSLVAEGGVKVEYTRKK